MKKIFILLISLSLYSLEPDFSITNHEMQIGNTPLQYTAFVGTLPIFSDEEKEAEIFFIAYEKQISNPDEKAQRPITFIFPGGPGGAGSVHAILGYGPKRLLTPDEGGSIYAPFTLIDNPDTLLTETDLIFIDPPDCGFSTISPYIDPSEYFQLEGDIETLSSCIYQILDLSNRWNSPIFLAGGSYGTMRACGVAGDLLQYGIAAKGLILDGCAFEFSTFLNQRDAPLADCLIIPTYAATAWYHQRCPSDQTLEETVEKARRFMYEEYVPYMFNPLSFMGEHKSLFEEKFASIVGLSVETVRRYQCRINEHIYAKEFFYPERKVLGQLDSRYISPIATIDPAHASDPSYKDSLAATNALRAYLTSELDYTLPPFPYKSFSSYAFAMWDYSTYDGFGLPNLLQRLRKIALINPHMEVLIGAGYYDCRTPFGAVEYCINHLELPEEYQKNFHFRYYEAGHGLILDSTSLKKWTQDITTFYRNHRCSVKLDSLAQEGN